MDNGTIDQCWNKGSAKHTRFCCTALLKTSGFCNIDVPISIDGHAHVPTAPTLPSEIQLSFGPTKHGAKTSSLCDEMSKGGATTPPGPTGTQPSSPHTPQSRTGMKESPSRARLPAISCSGPSGWTRNAFFMFLRLRHLPEATKSRFQETPASSRPPG